MLYLFIEVCSPGITNEGKFLTFSTPNVNKIEEFCVGGGYLTAGADQTFFLGRGVGGRECSELKYICESLFINSSYNIFIHKNKCVF